MKFGAELLPNKDIGKLINLGKEIEKNNFEQIWVSDHFNNRNTYCILSYLALNTDEIKMGPGVTNPYVTHPAESASAIQTINEMSEGRAIFGIGAGDKFTLNHIGLNWDNPLQRTRESIEIIRSLLEGKRLDFDGEFFELNSAKLDFGKDYQEIPIYLGAQGPQMLELAGEIAEGVLINASNPKEINLALKKVENSRSSKSTTKMAHTLFSIGKDRKKARKKAREVIAFIIDSFPDPVLSRNNISKSRVENISEELKNGHQKQATELVTENMVDSFSIAGNINDCINKLRSIKETGIDGVVLGSPIGPNKSEALKIVGEKIIGSFD